MTITHNRRAFGLRWSIGLVTCLLGGLLALAPAASAVAAGAVAASAVGVTQAQNVPDGLSIAITDGAADTASGTSSDYTVTITNRGAAPVAGELVVTLPPFVTFAQAKGSRLEEADARWKVTIAPGASERRHAAVVVGRIPAGQVRVTTLATLYASDDRSRILVRAADANAIQGVLDPAHTVGQSPRKVSAASNNPALPLIAVTGGAAALALVVGGAVLVRRREASRRLSRIQR